MPPTETPPQERRRRARVLLMALFAALALAFFPAWCMRYEVPESYHATYAEAPRESGIFPALMPPSAREIRARHDPDGGARWVRFVYAPADLPAMTRGARRLPEAEVKALADRMRPPPYTRWWQINPGTLRGSQGRRLEVYEIEQGPDRGWLAVDARTESAFFWSER